MGPLELLPGSQLGAELNGVSSFAEHDAETIPAPPPMPRAKLDTLEAIRDEHAEREREQILRVLRHVGGNVAKTSRVLGLSRYSLIRRMQKYGIANYRGQ